MKPVRLTALFLATVISLFARRAAAEDSAPPPQPPPVQQTDSSLPSSQMYGDSPADDNKPFELIQPNPHKWVASIGGGGFVTPKVLPRANLAGGTFQLALGRSWDFFDVEGDFGFGDASPKFDGLILAAVRARYYPIAHPKLGLINIGPYIAAGGGAGIEFGEIHGTGGPETLLTGDLSVGLEGGVKAGRDSLMFLFFDVGYAGVKASGNDIPHYLSTWKSARCGRGGIRFRF